MASNAMHTVGVRVLSSGLERALELSTTPVASSSQRKFLPLFATLPSIRDHANKVRSWVVSWMPCTATAPIDYLISRVEKDSSVMVTTSGGCVFMEYTFVNNFHTFGIVNEYGVVKILEDKNLVSLESKVKQYFECHLSTTSLESADVKKVPNTSLAKYQKLKKNLVDGGLIEEGNHFVSFQDRAIPKNVIFYGEDREHKLRLYLTWGDEGDFSSVREEKMGVFETAMMGTIGVTMLLGGIGVPTMLFWERMQSFQQLRNNLAKPMLFENMSCKISVALSGICATRGKNIACYSIPMLACSGQALMGVSASVVVGSPIPNQMVHAGQPFVYTVPDCTFYDITLNRCVTHALYSIALTAYQAGTNQLPNWLTFDSSWTFHGTDSNVEELNIVVSFYGSVGNIFQLNVYDTAPMVAHPISNQITYAGKPWSFVFASNTFYDSDGDPLTYTARLLDQEGLPSWVSFNALERRFSGTDNQLEIVNFAVMATDPFGKSAEVDFQVDVTDENPLVPNPLSDKNVHAGQPFHFVVPDNTFLSPNGNILSYSAYRVGELALPTWLSFNGTTKTFDGVDTNVEILNLMVKAEDAFHKTASSSFQLDVYNTPPYVATLIPDQSVHVGAELNCTLAPRTFVDPDGDALALSAALTSGKSLPSWLSFDSLTRRFMGNSNATASLDIGVTATDPFQQSASTQFSLEVYGISVVGTITDKITPSRVKFEYTVPEGIFNDRNIPMTYSAAQTDGTALPSWLNFDSQNRQFSGTPMNKNNEVLQIRVFAKDSFGAQAHIDFGLTIQGSNYKPPEVDKGIPDQSAKIGKLFTLTIPKNAFKDSNNSTLIYSATENGATSLPGWLSFNSATNTFSGSPNSAGNLVIRVTATNTFQDLAQVEFRLKIINETWELLKSLATIGGPALSVLGVIYSAYKGRHWLWNHFRKSQYRTPPQYVYLDGADLGYKLSVMGVEVIVFQNNIKGKPDWLKHNSFTNEISVKVSDLRDADVGEWTIQAVKDKRIREEFVLHIEKHKEGSNVSVEMQNAVQPTTGRKHAASSLQEPLLDTEDEL